MPRQNRSNSVDGGAFMTWTEIAGELGLTRQRVLALYETGIAKVRKNCELQNLPVEDLIEALAEDYHGEQQNVSFRRNAW